MTLGCAFHIFHYFFNRFSPFSQKVGFYPKNFTFGVISDLIFVLDGWQYQCLQVKKTQKMVKTINKVGRTYYRRRSR